MKRLFMAAIVAVLLLPLTATAGALTSIDVRADAVNKKVEGIKTYEAYLARKFAAFAEEELGQHDLNAARQFMELAEEAAAKAGGSK